MLAQLLTGRCLKPDGGPAVHDAVLMRAIPRPASGSASDSAVKRGSSISSISILGRLARPSAASDAESLLFALMLSRLRASLSTRASTRSVTRTISRLGIASPWVATLAPRPAKAGAQFDGRQNDLLGRLS